nr:hypothetical protein [Tanacetum cinerariifolium]
MVNVIPLDHVDKVPDVELNQHDDVHVVPEHVLVNEDEDSKEDEFKNEEDPQEEEDDMEIDIEEDENESELTYPYEEVDPLNPPSPASESEPDDEIEVENPIEHEDETVPASIHEVGESSAAPFLQEDSDSLLPGLMRRDINSLFGNEVRSSVEHETAAMEKLVEKLGNTKDKVGCKKLKKELEEARKANVRNEASGSGPAGSGCRTCRSEKKVRFAAATLQGPALSWWNAKIATMGLETVNQMPWTKMKQLMTVEFFPIEEIQRMEHEL